MLNISNLVEDPCRNRASPPGLETGHAEEGRGADANGSFEERYSENECGVSALALMTSYNGGTAPGVF